MLKIDGPAPTFQLEATHFTETLRQLESCLAWFTVDEIDAVVTDQGIKSVHPRVGESVLETAALASKPRLGKCNTFGAAIHTSEGLDHLAAEISALQEECFSLAVVVSSQAKVKTPQHMAGIAGKKRALRLVKHGQQFSARAQSEVIVKTKPKWEGTGPYLVVVSCSKGTLSLRISDPSVIGAVDSVEYEPDLPGSLRAVLGAEQVAEDEGSPTPSPQRSWRGATYEMWVFGEDILQNDRKNHQALTIIDRYFAEVYGAAK